MIAQQKLASARGNHSIGLETEQAFQMVHLRMIGHQVVAVRVVPKLFQLRLVDEYVRRARSVGTVFKIEVAAIQEKSVLAGIEKDG